MRPLWIGASGPMMISRTSECTPSAPITASAVARVPSAKRKRHRPAVLVEADQLLVEMDDLGAARPRPAPRAGRRDACRDRARRRGSSGIGSSRLTSPVSPTRFRCEYGAKATRAQPLLDADAAQHLHRVRHHLNAGADAREARAPARRPATSMPTRRSVAAAARPPMPAPTIAIDSCFLPISALLVLPRFRPMTARCGRPRHLQYQHRPRAIHSWRGRAVPGQNPMPRPTPRACVGADGRRAAGRCRRRGRRPCGRDRRWRG